VVEPSGTPSSRAVERGDETTRGEDRAVEPVHEREVERSAEPSPVDARDLHGDIPPQEAPRGESAARASRHDRARERTTEPVPSSEAALDAEPAPDPLGEEVVLLRRASIALRTGDATGALAATTEHAARFPTGQLALERDVTRALALCDLGRVVEARRVASGLSHPRLATSCVALGETR
jgi:hypothetical protein